MSNDDLRTVIRDVLQELLSESLAVSESTNRLPRIEGSGEPISTPFGVVEMVNIRSDSDIASFVKRLLHMYENPKSREDLRAGRIRFRLAVSSIPGSPTPIHRIESGAVTEAVVKEAAHSGAKLVLGSKAVVTPLARDRARTAGVIIEREEH